MRRTILTIGLALLSFSGRAVAQSTGTLGSGTEIDPGLALVILSVLGVLGYIAVEMRHPMAMFMMVVPILFTALWVTATISLNFLFMAYAASGMGLAAVGVVQEI